MTCEHLNVLELDSWYDIPELSDMRTVKCIRCALVFDELIPYDVTT